MQNGNYPVLKFDTQNVILENDIYCEYEAFNDWIEEMNVILLNHGKDSNPDIYYGRFLVYLHRTCLCIKLAYASLLKGILSKYGERGQAIAESESNSIAVVRYCLYSLHREHGSVLQNLRLPNLDDISLSDIRAELIANCQELLRDAVENATEEDIDSLSELVATIIKICPTPEEENPEKVSGFGEL